MAKKKSAKKRSARGSRMASMSDGFPDSLQRLQTVAEFLFLSLTSNVSARTFVSDYDHFFRSESSLWESVRAYGAALGVDFFDSSQGKRSVLSQSPDVQKFTHNFYRNAQIIAGALNSLKHSRPTAMARAEVHIALYPSMISYLGPALLSEIQKDSKLKVHLYPANDADIYQQLDTGTYHLAVANEDLPYSSLFTGDPLNYYWPYPGVIFRADAPRFANLRRLISAANTDAYSLLLELKKHPMYLLGSSSYGFDPDLHIAALNSRLSEAQGKQAPESCVYLPTYRQCRLVMRQGIGVGIGPPPIKPERETKGAFKNGCMIGMDAEAPDVPIAYIPGSYFVSQIFDDASGCGKFAVYRKKRYRSQPNVSENSSDHDSCLERAVDEIAKILTDICSGRRGTFGYLDFSGQGNKKALRHNYLY